MKTKRFFKSPIVIALILIVISFFSLYAYNIFHQSNMNTPEKVYKDVTETEMQIVQQNISNVKQQQKHRKDQQKLLSEKPAQAENSPSQDSGNSNMDNSSSSKSYNLDEDKMMRDDNMVVFENTADGQPSTMSDLIRSGKIPDVDGLNQAILNKNSTFQTNSIEELRNYISKLEQSDNPKHKSIAQRLKTSLNGMNPPEGVTISVSIPDLPELTD